MSSQIRYRTLVDHLARIYEATDETRTGRLQEGLTKVLETIDPKGSDGWQQVKVDSMRLLRVWRAREDCQGDSTLADQILDALSDFAAEDVPRLEISERPAAAVVVTPPPEPVVVAAHDEAAAIEAALAVAIAAEADEEETDEEDAEVEPALEEETDEDEDEDEDEEAEEETIVAAAPTPATTEEEGEVVEPEADSDEEEEDADEEEEGVEVEKRTIRGREYWLSSDGTLYAVAEDDEIGDEVGRITKEGRPVFLAPK
jgi:hypothetical protein